VLVVVNETERAVRLAKQLCHDAALMQEDALRMRTRSAEMRVANELRSTRLLRLEEARVGREGGVGCRPNEDASGGPPSGS
jgi:hypothetical protein